MFAANAITQSHLPPPSLRHLQRHRRPRREGPGLEAGSPSEHEEHTAPENPPPNDTAPNSDPEPPPPSTPPPLKPAAAHLARLHPIKQKSSQSANKITPHASYLLMRCPQPPASFSRPPSRRIVASLPPSKSRKFKRPKDKTDKLHPRPPAFVFDVRRSRVPPSSTLNPRSSSLPPTIPRGGVKIQKVKKFSHLNHTCIKISHPSSPPSRPEPHLVLLRARQHVADLFPERDPFGAFLGGQLAQ
jgi:hypothetical protein